MNNDVLVLVWTGMLNGKGKGFQNKEEPSVTKKQGRKIKNISWSKKALLHLL